MADQYQFNSNEEKMVKDHLDRNTKEIDLINRDPKQINEGVVKVGAARARPVTVAPICLYLLVQCMCKAKCIEDMCGYWSTTRDSIG